MNVHHLELFYFVAKHGGIAAAVWNRPNLRTKGISAPGEGRHRAAQCHSKCLSRERSYDRLRNIDAKAADRAKKAPLSTAVGIDLSQGGEIGRRARLRIWWRIR